MVNYLIGVVGAPLHEGAQISDILTEGTALFSWVMTQLATLLTTVTSNGILLIGFIMVLVGFVIGIFRRLVNVS